MLLMLSWVLWVSCLVSVVCVGWAGARQLSQGDDDGERHGQGELGRVAVDGVVVLVEGLLAVGMALRHTEQRGGDGRVDQEYADEEVLLQLHFQCLQPGCVRGTGSDDGDPWWRHRNFVNEFNKTRQDVMLISRMRVLDETMSALRPR